MTAWERFGVWLKAERDRAGISQAEVARRSGVTDRQCSRMESGLRTRAVAKRETVDRIAVAVGADPAVARLVAGLDELSPDALRIAALWGSLDEDAREQAEALLQVIAEQSRRRQRGDREG